MLPQSPDSASEYTQPVSTVAVATPEISLVEGAQDLLPTDDPQDSFETLTAPIEKMTTLDRVITVIQGWGFVATDVGEASTILLIDKERTKNKPAHYLNHVLLHQSQDGVHTDKPEAAPQAIVKRWIERKQEAERNALFINELDEYVQEHPQLSVTEALTNYADGLSANYVNRTLRIVKNVAVFSWLSTQRNVSEFIKRKPYDHIENIWNELLEHMTREEFRDLLIHTDGSNRLRAKYWQETVKQASYHEAVQALVAHTTHKDIA